MSWLDPQRSQEPAEDTLLREELRALLGVRQPRNYFEAEPTPELVALAEELRKEARRRNRTARKQTHWMLLAAALPLAIAFGGVSLWGIAQKHKAEDLAQAVAAREAEVARMAATLQQRQAEPAVNRSLQRTTPALLAGEQRKAIQPKGKELVIPVDSPAGLVPRDTQQVKSH